MAIGALLATSACAGDRGGASNGDGSAFPTKQIRFVVHAPAGGGSDTTSRALTAELEKILGQDIIVENRTGGGGSTALQYVAGQNPDGYTLGYMPVELGMLPHRGADVDPAKYDLLGQLVNIPGAVAVPKDSPYQTMADLIEASKSKAVPIAITGAGGVWDMATTALNKAAQSGLRGVPFDGDAPAVAAVSGKQTEAVMAGVPTVLPAAKDGNLRALMVLSDERLAELPDVPTAKELGYDLPFGGWGGVGAPAGLPDDVRRTLEEAIAEARASEGFTSTIARINSTVVNRNGAEFEEFVKSQSELFGQYL
ncbi:tripartite tricarboxylate transporter substrate binding protein [Phytohabitans kaempferiae]|uniref:Tripartite tricarboxylate transporter substrate binding protein n=1 Tax=Phytohabitans kaempferiae TaxID=1620943 RepID=A0ABV6M9N2_9ACTN